MTLPEAGGVAWTELYGQKTDEEGVVHDVKINLTARAETATEALKALLEALKVASEEYKLRPYQVLKKAPEAPPAPAPLDAPAAPVGKPEPTYEDVEQATGVFNVVKMGVTPRADGKTKLDFYEFGHKYPDISAVMSPDQLSQMLAAVGAWTPEHFKAVASYEVNYKISWRNSERLNQNGKPYKNIVVVNPA